MSSSDDKINSKNLVSTQNKRKAVAALVAARIVYAIIWLNIGAIFYLIGPDLNSGVSGLGLLASSFYLGIGIFQIPGGILAARLGPKRVVVLGVFMTSLAALGTSFSGNLQQFAILRFIVGAGMALQFAPGVVLIAMLLGGSANRSKSGISVGIFNSAFGVGGLFGLFGWTIIASLTGWRPSLALSGVLGVLTGLLMLALVPRDSGAIEFKLSKSELLKVLRDKALIILGLGTLSLSIGNNLIATFMAYYLHVKLGIAPVLAGLVPTITVVIPIFSALWGARLYDRMKKPRLLMIASCASMSGSLLISAVPSVLASAVAATLGGVAFGVGLTVTFAAARDLNRAQKEYDSLAVSWVNCISLTGLFWPPLLFSYLAVSLGYQEAWLGGALVEFLLFVPLFFMAEGIRTKQ